MIINKYSIVSYSKTIKHVEAKQEKVFMPMVSSVLVEKSLRYPVHRGVNQDTQKSQLFTRCTVPNNNLNFRVKTEPVTVGASECMEKNNYERWWGWMKLHEEKKSRDTGLGDILWHIIWKVKISIDFDHQKRKMCEWNSEPFFMWPLSIIYDTQF